LIFAAIGSIPVLPYLNTIVTLPQYNQWGFAIVANLLTTGVAKVLGYLLSKKEWLPMVIRFVLPAVTLGGEPRWAVFNIREVTVVINHTSTLGVMNDSSSLRCFFCSVTGNIVV
jgi:hypothetical protein